MKHIHCPVNGWDCPYYTDKGHPCRCLLEHPEEDCDDFTAFWDPIEDDGDWLDDDWTVVTRDGSLSAHYENTVLITENGPVLLTLSK